jgi:hypothetical protein
MLRRARGVPPLALAPVRPASPRADLLGLWIGLCVPAARSPGA